MSSSSTITMLILLRPLVVGSIRSGETAIVVATDLHCRAFRAKLESVGIDANREHRQNFVFLDAATTMSRFITEGRIDRAGFHAVVGGIIRDALQNGLPVRVYGEMVALLWEEGDVVAAIELESLWNELGNELPFSLFCAYPNAVVSGSEHIGALQQICHLHSSVTQLTDDDGCRARGSDEIKVTAKFGATSDAPRAARHFVLNALRQLEYAQELIDDAALISTELATNAVVHAKSPFSVVVQTDGPTVRISVHDLHVVPSTIGKKALPVRRGHGIGLVDALAYRWGIDSPLDGKIVWAELRR